jgi:pyridinium-3,5-bisthiocarboxylic acid mononucleotide nickel chelatase
VSDSGEGDTVWVDASNGASGDMLLAALWDVGVPASVMADAARSVAPVSVTFGREARHGFDVARAYVVAAEDDAPHRTWGQVRDLLERADLAPVVLSTALAAFGRLADAEGRVHGIDPEQVHFHEVGAHDAIGDVVGVCAGFAWLGGRVRVGPIALGGGMIGGGTGTTGHGVLPVPGPAVLGLLAGAGAPAFGGPVDIELCTPTGAALLTTLADGYGAMPSMLVDAVGSGCGSRVLPDRLGALRLVRGTAVEPASEGAAGVGLATMLETNVDDLDPRVWPHVLDRLLAAGASDAWLTPILMKKGRPAHTLHVLAGDDPELVARLQGVVFAETSAIGLRRSTVAKAALEREQVTVDVGGRAISVKLARIGGRVVNAQPEHDDVLAAAVALDLPLKLVLARATAAATALMH